MVEIEIGVLAGQCLDRRIESYPRLTAEVAAWEKQRNGAQARIDWSFTAENVRTKMGRAYPRPTNLKRPQESKPLCQGTEWKRIQMAEKPPSTAKSIPFTKLESSEARNSATDAISSGRPIVPRGIRDSNICFASAVRTWSCIGVAGSAPGTQHVHPDIPALQFVEPRACE